MFFPLKFWYCQISASDTLTTHIFKSEILTKVSNMYAIYGIQFFRGRFTLKKCSLLKIENNSF